MAGMILTISSGVAGPLGVLHLPRFWSKVLLDSKGQLHEDKPACGAGFDQMVLDGLGLDKVRYAGIHQRQFPNLSTV